jgi:signal transduction histidine kinase
LLNVASFGAILRDRNSLAVREKLRALLGQILESLEIGVLVLDRSGSLTLANESARGLLPGMPAAPFGCSYLDLLRDYPEIKEIVRSALEEGGYVKEVEHNIGSINGPYAVRITTLPLRDLHRRAIGSLLLVNDVREMVAMERQIRTAERLSALGTLAAALAHEIRNPLEAMNLNLALLARALDESGGRVAQGSRKKKYLGILESELSRLAGIVENFLSFARPSRSTTGRITLDEILRRIVEVVGNQAKSCKVEIELIPGGRPVVVDGFEDQLKQAFLNVIINSLEAMPNGGKLTVWIECLGKTGSESTGATAAIRIQDTGEGIPPEQIGRLFDPFFSTKPRGTGLGLTIAHRVIQDHRGRICVESTLGKGTTLTIELPLAR